VKPGSPLADLRLDQLTPAAVEGWVAWASETKAQSTVRSSYTVLRAVGDTAVRDGLLAASPAAKVDRPRVDHVEARFLNRDEVAALRKALEGSRYAPIVDLLLRTGMRRGEALALHWADVDLEARTARVTGSLARQGRSLVVSPPKTARGRRTVPLGAAAVALLREVRAAQQEERAAAANLWEEHGLVFTTDEGKPVDPRNALRALTVAAKRAGLEGVELHTLRHTAASMLLSAGVPLKVLSDILGHGSISVTADLYGHLQPDVAHAAMDALDAALR